MMNKQIEKNINTDVEARNAFTETRYVSEDELLASSQETITNLPSTSKGASANKTTQKVDKQPTLKQMKSRYQRACFILKKIEANKQAGKSDPRDEKDEVECRKVVEVYERHLATRKMSEKTKPAKKDRFVSSKRDRSLDETASTASSAKRPKLNTTKRAYADVAKDDLSMGLVDENGQNNQQVGERWGEIEAKLTLMVIDHLMADPSGLPPTFDSSLVIRGCRVIKCDNLASKDFLTQCIAKISNAWEGLRLKLIPAREIPWRPRARIWLPKLSGLSNEKFIQVLKMQNPLVNMNDWQVLRAEKPNKNSMSYLLLIKEENIEDLRKLGNKLKFGIRHAKMKIFLSTATDEEVDEVMETCSLPEDTGDLNDATQS